MRPPSRQGQRNGVGGGAAPGLFGRAALDMRLAPAAALVWAAVAAQVMFPRAGLGAALTVAGLGLVATITALWPWLTTGGNLRAIMFFHRALPTLVAPVLVVVVAAMSTWLKLRRAQQHPLSDEVGGVATTEFRLASDPELTQFGSSATAIVEGLPGKVAVFGDEALLHLRRDTVVEASAVVKESTRPSVAGLELTIRGEPTVIQPAQGITARVRETLRDSSSELWHGPDRLFPAMAIGDESRFTPADKAMLNDSGLSHLSAVSGANVALVVGTVMLAMSWAGPRLRVAAAAVALASFVSVVGAEPSVLRAAVTGTVGLVAILMGRSGQSIAALSAGVIGLVIAFPDLAVSVGFALSVAATAGLVLLAEPLARRLILYHRFASLPAPIVRAVAVSVVAHCVTVPVLGLLVGQVSNVSLVANLLAAPAVAPVTITGSLAAFAAALGLPWLSTALAYLAAPFAWWIYHVAAALSSAVAPATDTRGIAVSCLLTALCFTTLWLWPAVMTNVAATAATATAVVFGVTSIFGLDIPRAAPGWSAAVCWEDTGPVFIVAVGDARGSPAPAPPMPGSVDRSVSRRCRLALGLSQVRARQVTAAQARAKVVESPSYVDKAAVGQTSASESEPLWFVAVECGRRVRQVVLTPQGTPVVCPVRDGPQTLYQDGSVWRGAHGSDTWQRRIYGNGTNARVDVGL